LENGDLIHGDISPKQDNYSKQECPRMNNKHQHREEELFHAALEMSDRSKRESYLRESCGEDLELRSGVEELIRAHESAAGQLWTESDRGILSSAGEYVSEKVGDRVGRYKLLERIGEGGFGVVYRAEQEDPVRRQVALKILKAGMDTRQVVGRFEAERQALALMEHPNIASVFDGGATEGGRPFFVMELVVGQPITVYCDEHRLNTAERLELFAQVCKAVQHAHQKGVIHRDLKPANILVMEQDGRAMPKVIDFGVAKAIEQRLTDRPLSTLFGQLIGTPAYMSPEQAGLGGLDIDTRSDVYSLGAVLYELLTGAPPFEAKRLLEGGHEAIVRTIREVEPPTPSARLTDLSPDESRMIGCQRRSAPQRLRRLVRGELDWIVMRALEKDRGRRYETVNGLAMDVQRYLRNEPVAARRPGRVYLLAKTIRRNKLAFGIAALFATMLIIGAAVSAWQARRLVAAEAKSQQVAQFLEEMLASVGPSVALGRDTVLLREILDKAADRIARGLDKQPAVKVNLQRTVARVYGELGDYPKAEELLRDALSSHRSALGREHLEIAAVLSRLAGAVAMQGRLDEAETLAREGLIMSRKLASS
jgi:eukaryotic-like serine/threonine-protein kinase